MVKRFIFGVVACFGFAFGLNWANALLFQPGSEFGSMVVQIFKDAKLTYKSGGCIDILVKDPYAMYACGDKVGEMEAVQAEVVALVSKEFKARDASMDSERGRLGVTKFAQMYWFTPFFSTSPLTDLRFDVFTVKNNFLKGHSVVILKVYSLSDLGRTAWPK